MSRSTRSILSLLLAAAVAVVIGGFAMAKPMAAWAAPLTPAGSLVVTNTDATGTGSLAAAVDYVNSIGGGTITFDSTVFSASTPQTITLISEFDITVPLTVTGPGADAVTIKQTATGATGARHFYVNGSNYPASTFTGLTLDGSGVGGGIYGTGPVTVTG